MTVEYSLFLIETFSVFLRLFDQRILKQQHPENAAKSAEVQVLELLKLQNALRPQAWMGDS